MLKMVQMFDQLIIGAGSTVKPGVLEKWEMAPDAQSYTFYVRKGIKFHNGEELNADDVKFSIERYTSPDSSFTETRIMVDRVEKIDDYTVRVFMKGAQPFYLESGMAIMGRGQSLVTPKDYFEKVGVDKFSQQPLGSGPFRFVRYTVGDMIEYEGVDKHWRLTPGFKKLSIIKIPEESTRVALLKVNQVDAIDISSDSSQELEMAGFRVASLTGDQALILFVGNYLPAGAKYPTSDVRVRQALSLAINRDEMIKLLFYGKALPPLPHPVSATSAGLDIPYWKDYAAKVYRYDPEEAKRLMKEAGYAAGFSMKFYVGLRAQEAYWPKVAEVVQGYWSKIGVKAELIPVDYAVVRNKRNTLKDPDWIGAALTTTVSAAPIVAGILRNSFHSKQVFAPLGTAFPDLDNLLDRAFVEIDAAKRKAMEDEAIKIVTDTHVALMIAGIPGLVAISPKVDVALPAPPTPALFGYYIETAKHK